MDDEVKGAWACLGATPHVRRLTAEWRNDTMLTALRSYLRASERSVPAFVRQWTRPTGAADVLYGRDFLKDTIPAGGCRCRDRRVPGRI